MLKTDGVTKLSRAKEQNIQSGGDRHSIRVISVTSGKGGVGKSNVVINIALAFKKLGLKVLVLDGDFGLANLDILLNLHAKKNLHDVLHGNGSVRDIIIKSVYGVDIIPSSSGILSMCDLSIHERSQILSGIEEFDLEYDVLLIDTAAGISSDVIWLNSMANEVIVVTTPEPTAITDAYAMMKVLHQTYKVKKVKLLVNQVKNPSEGLKVYNKISEVTDRFLNIGIDYIGSIRWDGCMSEAVKKRQPVLTSYPHSASSENFGQIAKALFQSSKLPSASGNSQFFWQSLAGNV